jgi:hypothetical protein
MYIHLVYLVIILVYFSRFSMLHQDKSGKPAAAMQIFRVLFFVGAKFRMRSFQLISIKTVIFWNFILRLNLARPIIQSWLFRDLCDSFLNISAKKISAEFERLYFSIPDKNQGFWNWK